MHAGNSNLHVGLCLTCAHCTYGLQAPKHAEFNLNFIPTFCACDYRNDALLTVERRLVIPYVPSKWIHVCCAACHCLSCWSGIVVHIPFSTLDVINWIFYRCIRERERHTSIRICCSSFGAIMFRVAKNSVCVSVSTKYYAALSYHFYATRTSNERRIMARSNFNNCAQQRTVDAIKFPPQPCQQCPTHSACHACISNFETKWSVTMGENRDGTTTIWKLCNLETIFCFIHTNVQRNAFGVPH